MNVSTILDLFAQGYTFMYGSYRPDNPFRQGHPKEIAREHFWRAIREVAPEVFHALREDVLPVARVFFVESRSGTKPDRMPLVEALYAWAKDFNLHLSQGQADRFELWAYDKAFNQITQWFFDEENPGGITAELILSEPGQKRIKHLKETLRRQFEKERSLLIALPSPGVSSDKWEKFEKDVLKRIREHRKHLVWKSGWQKVPIKRNLEHFEWLVRYQVQGWRLSRIAKEYLPQNENCSDLTNTVRDALKATAELCGLALKKYRPGRPSKED